MSRPSSRQASRTSAGVPLKVTRSFSKISTASNLAAAMASSFSPRVPLRETVAIEVFISGLLYAGLIFRHPERSRPLLSSHSYGEVPL